MSTNLQWQAGFELEVILGHLGERQFKEELRDNGPMDLASPEFCRAFAAKLTTHTKRRWSAPSKHPKRPGFYVIPEYGLDPLNWPRDRLAGVELLTPPLSLEEADIVRFEIIEAIGDIDGDFNFYDDDHTHECGWHINIDASERCTLDPLNFIIGVDELVLLERNNRHYTNYTALQRHAVGIPLLRHLQDDPEGKLLRGTGLDNLLRNWAGRDKRYAANFAKLTKGYLELRHFSAESFFHGGSITNQLDRITTALKLPPSERQPLEDAFLQKFLILSRWLAQHRQQIAWQLKPGMLVASGTVHFYGRPVGHLTANGPVDINLFGTEEAEPIATIRDIVLADIDEGIALLALDLAELHNLGISERTSNNELFQEAVLDLATRLREDDSISNNAQLEALTANRPEIR